MAFLHGEPLTRAIRQVVAAGPVDIAVAFWGNGACDHLNLPDDLEQYRIACDARSGFCSPSTLAELQRRGALVVDVPYLHAKVYSASQAMVVASANSSGKALSVDRLATFGLEAGILETDSSRLEAAREWLESLFANRRALGAGDLNKIESLWKAQRASRPGRKSLIDAILTNAPDLADRDIRAYVYTTEKPTPDHYKTYRQTPYFNPDGWEQRSDDPFFHGEMPSTVKVGDTLLCFAVDGTTAEFDGVWQILARVETGKRTIWPSSSVNRPLGRALGGTTEIERRVSLALKAGRLLADADPLPLPKFAARIASDVDEAEHLRRIVSEEARAAYRYLVRAAPDLGFSGSYKTGRVPAVRWHDASDDYLFSFIPNKADLLFYVRHPALRRALELAQEAQQLRLEWAWNPSKELTLRIRNEADAGKIVGWLSKKLPLSSS